MTSDALASSAWQWFGIGLGAAFLATMAVVVVLIARAEKKSGIDQGFLGLILLLCTIFYLLGFSFLVAASVKGMDIKLAVVAVDALVLLGSKLLTPHFLEYLISDLRITKMPQGLSVSEIRYGAS